MKNVFDAIRANTTEEDVDKRAAYAQLTMKTNKEFWSELNTATTDIRVKSGALLKEPDLDERIINSFLIRDDAMSVLIFFESLESTQDIERIKPHATTVTEFALIGNADHIVLARRVLNLIPKDWLFIHIELMAEEVISKHLAIEGAYWLYMRLLELYDHLGFFQLLERLFKYCAASDDEDLREIAEDHAGMIPQLTEFGYAPSSIQKPSINEATLRASAQRALLFNIIPPVQFIFVQCTGDKLLLFVYVDRELTDEEKDIYDAVSGEMCGDFTKVNNSEVRIIVYHDRFELIKDNGDLVYARHEYL